MKDTQTNETAGARPENVRNSIVKISPEYKLEKVAQRPNSTRPGLENIKLAKSERFGNCAIATQGRSMAVVPVEVDGENDGGLISVEALKASRKNKPLEGRLILDGQIELPGGAVFVRPNESENRYPNWQVVIPGSERKTTFSIGLNPKLLVELAQAIGAGDEIVRLEFQDERSPVVMTRCGSRSNGEYGVLMPGRLS